jgi:1-deoxy-D-xylulose-5-phosphate synthase/(E)-4-hydroxy-3-methyl-but-2-enyl pyrophosphate reductase
MTSETPSAGRMVLLASPRSLCAGVERAIETVERALRMAAGPVYVRKQIVHNSHVVAGLRARGAIFVDELDEVPDPPPDGAVVVFSAHGVSPAVRAEAARRGLDVIDATCPLVTKVHAEARRHAARGDTIVLIGHAGHEEVEGTLGEAPDRTVLVESADQVACLRLADDAQVAYLAQTTLAVDETREVIDALLARYPDAVGQGEQDICYAITNRQHAVAAVAAQADLVQVVGSGNSSNSLRLVEVARRHGAAAQLIEGATAIDASWLDGVRTIGVTAGASAPQHLVTEVLDQLTRLGPRHRPRAGHRRADDHVHPAQAGPPPVRGDPLTIEAVTIPESSARLPLLSGVSDPAALRELSGQVLPALAAEIRALLVDKVCASGGHLGVNLGVVELTIALHRVFDSPRDVLLFDTGHQAYVHKILTGRQAAFDGLRRRGGLSGYPSRSESEHDWIESSHASTALSYADGIAKALHLAGHLAGTDHVAEATAGRHVIAVIGDGALTGGLALEGLNNLAAAPDRPVIIVLNDNGRSYDPTAGGLATHLTALRGRGPWQSESAPANDTTVVKQSTVFEQLGLAYLGPVDGHDIGELEHALRYAACLNRPVVVHAVTEKGHGWQPAEADAADRMHGIGVLDPATGAARGPSKPSWTSVFAEEMVQIGHDRDDVVAITAAMRIPVGLHEFGQAFPSRLFDVGIAEQQAVCSAAGLAMGGLHPVVAVYATFLNRAFDQVLMDVALHRLPVTFVLDRAGITGPDGASHHGMWDTTILSAVPGLRVAAPRDPARLRELFREAIAADGPTVVRYPKAAASADIPAIARMDGIDILHRSPGLSLDVLVAAAGVMAQPALQAARILEAEGIGVTVVDPRWILPIHPTITHLAARHRLVVTVEDSIRSGGAGTAIALALADADVTTPLRVLGLPRAFIHAGDRADLLVTAGLTGEGIASTVRAALTPGGAR